MIQMVDRDHEYVPVEATQSRHFLPLPDSINCASTSSSIRAKPTTTIRVLQFNILGDGLSALTDHLGHFSRVKKKHLEWDYRKQKLLHEITQYNPDVITLQEVDHYYDHFLPELYKKGYVGHFAPKPTSACLEVSDNSDGCALFVKRSKLRILSCETKTLALSIAGLTDSGELLEDDKSIMAQNQVGLIAVCELVDEAKDTKASEVTYCKTNGAQVVTKHESPPIIIGTTHLKSSKTYTGERYRQKGILQVLTSISRIYTSYSKTGRTPVVILTGDFNAETGKINYEPLCYRAVKRHSLGLRSVYNEDGPNSLSPFSSTDLYSSWKMKNCDDRSNVKCPISSGSDVSSINITGEKISGNIRAIAKATEVAQDAAMGVAGGMEGIAVKGATDRKEVEVKRAIDYIFYTPYVEDTTGVDDGKLESTNGLGSDLVAVNNAQIAIASLMRFTVYFFGALFPFTSLVSTTLTAEQRTLVLLTSILFLYLFEISSAGSVFRPAVAAGVDEIQEEKGRTDTFLNKVAKVSQSIQPLPQYGRPGIKAVSVLDLFSDEQIGPDRLPSERYPSDHIAIAADLMLVWAADE